jgi:2-iminobutanoate/2-iminopropanoate deaminase
MSTPPFTTFVDAGPLVFLSGQLASDDREIVSGDTAAQTRRCLERVELVLRDAGLPLSQLVECTIWLSHEADVAAFSEAYAAYFGSQGPAHSTMFSRLAVAGALVEIDAIACREALTWTRSPTLPVRKRSAGGRATSRLKEG